MYELLRTIHLIAVSPCLIIGAYLIYFSSKGSGNHKNIGWAYMIFNVFSSRDISFYGGKSGTSIFKSFWMDPSTKYSDYIHRTKEHLLYKEG